MHFMILFLSGISQQAISKLENGKSSPSEYTMRQLAAALHIPLSELIDENKEEMDLCYYGGLVCPYFEVVDGYAEIYLYTPLDEDVVLYEIYIQAIKVAD